MGPGWLTVPTYPLPHRRNDSHSLTLTVRFPGRIRHPRGLLQLLLRTVEFLDGPVDPRLVLAVDESVTPAFDKHVSRAHSLLGE